MGLDRISIWYINVITTKSKVKSGELFVHLTLKYFFGFNRNLLPLKMHPHVNALDIQRNVYSVCDTRYKPYDVCVVSFWIQCLMLYISMRWNWIEYNYTRSWTLRPLTHALLLINCDSHEFLNCTCKIKHAVLILEKVKMPNLCDKMLIAWMLQ